MNAQATQAASLIAVPADGAIVAIHDRRAEPDEKGGRRTQDAVPVILAEGDDAPMPRVSAAERKKAEARARIVSDVNASLARAAGHASVPVKPEEVNSVASILRQVGDAQGAAEVEAEAPSAAAKMLADVRQGEAATAAPAIPSTGYQGPMRSLRERLKQGAYKKMPNGQPANGDEVATLLGGLEPAEVIKACMAAMALDANPYAHLNIGQQSMNLRNKLRGALKRGEFGIGVLREEVEDIVSARPAPAPATSAAPTPAPAPEAVPAPGAVEEPSKAADPINAETRSEASKKANASRTPADRSAAAKKAAATRAAKAKK